MEHCLNKEYYQTSKAYPTLSISWPAICDIWLGKSTVPVPAVAKEVAALQRWLRSRSGRTRTDRRRTAEKLFVWSFVCRFSGCFSSLFEVTIGLRLLIECSNLTCFAKEKAAWLLGGEIDDRCRLHVRRTSGAESEFETGKISRGRRVQTETTKKKTHHRRTNLNPDEYESKSQSFTGGMHNACTSACGGLALDRSCSVHVAVPRHLLGYLKALLLGWRTVLLSTSWSGVKWLENEEDKRQEHVRRRKKKVIACMRTARTVSKTPTLTLLEEVLRASQAWAFFLWKQCTLNYYLKS